MSVLRDLKAAPMKSPTRGGSSEGSTPDPKVRSARKTHRPRRSITTPRTVRVAAQIGTSLHAHGVRTVDLSMDRRGPGLRSLAVVHREPIDGLFGFAHGSLREGVRSPVEGCTYALRVYVDGLRNCGRSGYFRSLEERK
jgi:hypothetical protein